MTVPGAENLKRRNLEYNGVGWLTSVCEAVTSTLPAGGACGQAVGYSGYLTKYTYDGRRAPYKGAAENAPQSSGTQTRTISYDGLGRKAVRGEFLSGAREQVRRAAEPYAYDSDSLEVAAVLTLEILSSPSTIWET